jgi:hypothetical protein
MRRSMRLFGHDESGGLRASPWRGLLIHLAASCLLMSLTSRYMDTSSSQASTAQCNSAKAKVQHLDRGALSWTVPVAALFPELPPILTSRVVPQADPLFTFHLDGTLYDRPPPVS